MNEIPVSTKKKKKIVRTSKIYSMIFHFVWTIFCFLSLYQKNKSHATDILWGLISFTSYPLSLPYNYGSPSIKIYFWLLCLLSNYLIGTCPITLELKSPELSWFLPIHDTSVHSELFELEGRPFQWLKMHRNTGTDKIEYNASEGPAFMHPLQVHNSVSFFVLRLLFFV